MVDTSFNIFQFNSKVEEYSTIQIKYSLFLNDIYKHIDIQTCIYLTHFKSKKKYYVPIDIFWKKVLQSLNHLILEHKIF